MMASINGSYVGENYKIEKPISFSGGTASVFMGSLVQNPNLKAAIKFAHTGENGPGHEDILLQREADLISRWEWRHPGIVRLYPIPSGLGTSYILRAHNLENQPWYMVMEYLAGGSWDENAKKIKSFSLEWKLEMFYQILTAVSFMHQKGFGHRDLKPGNVMFRKPINAKEVPEVVLIDFALTSNGKSGSAIVDNSFTVEYAGPERLLRGMMTDRSEGPDLYPMQADIWSLGILLYELLTGQLPIRGGKEKFRTSIISGGLADALERTNYYKFLKTERIEYREKIPTLAKYIRWILKSDPVKRPCIKELIYGLEEKILPPRISAN